MAAFFTAFPGRKELMRTDKAGPQWTKRRLK